MTQSWLLVLTCLTVLQAVTQPGTAGPQTDVGRDVAGPGAGAEVGVETAGPGEMTETAGTVRDGEAQGGADQTASEDSVETVGLVTPVAAHSSVLAPADHLVRYPDTSTAILTPHSLLARPPGANLLSLVTAVRTVSLAVTDLGW